MVKKYVSLVVSYKCNNTLILWLAKAPLVVVFIAVKGWRGHRSPAGDPMIFAAEVLLSSAVEGYVWEALQLWFLKAT